MSSSTDKPKKSEKQKMLDGEIYDASSYEILIYLLIIECLMIFL